MLTRWGFYQLHSLKWLTKIRVHNWKLQTQAQHWYWLQIRNIWGFSVLSLGFTSDIVLSFLEWEKEVEKRNQVRRQSEHCYQININFTNRVIPLLLPNIKLQKSKLRCTFHLKVSEFCANKFNMELNLSFSYRLFLEKLFIFMSKLPFRYLANLKAAVVI